MRFWKKFTLFAIASFIVIGLGFAQGALGAVLQGFGGGTGIGNSTSGADGLCLKQTSSTPFLTYMILPCGTSGGGGGVATSTLGVYTPGNIAFFTNSSTISASNALSIVSSTGAVTITVGSLNLNNGTVIKFNSVPVTDAGGDWIYNIIQNFSGSIISQNPTGTTSVGNFVQNGGVQYITASTSLTGTQFCSGGEFYILNTSTQDIVITLPSTSTISGSVCGSGIWTGGFSQQFIINSSSSVGNVRQAASGSNEVFLYSPGTPTSLAPGQEWYATGQFENTSTLQGATSTNTIFVVKTQLYTSSTIANALVLSNSIGGYGPYAGSATCGAGYAVSVISATGTVTCIGVGVATSSALTVGQWVIAAGVGSIYSTSSQPIITLIASGTNITVSGPSATGSAVVSIQSNPTFGNLLATNVSTTNLTVSGTLQFLTAPVDGSNNKYSTSTTPLIHTCYGNEVSFSVDTVVTGFSATTTLNTVWAMNSKSGANAASGSINFNLGFTTSTSNPTSTWSKLFTSNQVVASVGTSTRLTVNGSTTWPSAIGNPGNLPWLLGYWTDQNSSSSEFCFDVSS